jgi:hypothetical protein
LPYHLNLSIIIIFISFSLLSFPSGGGGQHHPSAGVSGLGHSENNSGFSKKKRRETKMGKGQISEGDRF